MRFPFHSDSGNNQAGFLNLHQNLTTGFIKRFIAELKDCDTPEMILMAPNVVDENSTRQITWIKHVFIPKISKWIVSMEADCDERKKSAFDSVESLSLINLTEYNQLYNDLKTKYGEHMVKVNVEKFEIFFEIFRFIGQITMYFLYPDLARKHGSIEIRL